MQYIIKKGDTLRKIARKHKTTIQVIICTNPELYLPYVLVEGQIIDLFNMSDVPQHSAGSVSGDVDDLPLTNSAAIRKARSVINSRIVYKLGSGGMHPESTLPSNDGNCDCSGFLCWVLGFSRKTTAPFYAKFGGWIFTDSIAEDIYSRLGIFERLQFPEEGCVVVYSAGAKIGHVGLVSVVTNNLMKKVIHCSSGNSRNYGAAIQETNSDVFNRPDAIWGRFLGGT